MADSIQKQRLEKICDDLACEFPNMYNVVDRLKWKASDSIPTAAVDRQGRGIFNPEFIESKGLDELRFICMHEAMHVILLHLQRMGKIEDLYMPAANWAADYVINTNLSNNGFVVGGEYICEWNAKELTGKTADEIKDLSFEEIYGLILEHLESQSQGGSSQQSNSGQGSQGNQRGSGSSGSQGDQNNRQSNSSGGSSSSDQDPQQDESQSGGSNNGDQEEQGDQGDNSQGAGQGDEDSDKGSNGGSSDSDNSPENDPLDGDLGFEKVIAEEYGDEQGDLSNDNGSGCGHQDDKATMEALLEESNIDLKKLLDAFVYKTSGRGAPKRSYRRPNKRYRNVYPLTKGRVQEKPKDIVFAVDVSSSMDVEKTSRALSAVSKYAERYSVGLKYYFWSSCCSKIYDFTNQKKFVSDFKRNYGGGTEISAALRSRTTDGLKNFAGVVIISDFEFGCYDYEDRIKDCGTDYFLVNVDKDTDLSSFPENKYCNCY